MKIVIFACVDYPEGPATTSRIKLLSRILTDAGHQVSLAIFNANAKKPIPGNRFSRGTHDSVEYLYLSGNTVRPVHLPGAIVDTLKGIVQSISYLKEKKKADAIDMVLLYTPDIFRSLPIIVLSKLFGIPILLELCEIFSSDMRSCGVKSAIMRMGARLSDRTLHGTSSGVLAISTKIVDYLKLHGMRDKNILHLPILVDSSRFMEPSRSPVPILQEKRYFLNSGALDAKEGLEFVLKAFAPLSKIHDQLYMAFTGNPDDRRKSCVLELAKKLGIEHKLLFTGFLPLEQLSWAYQNALALICCRTDTAFSNYGFPTKLAEYLCSGRPVIINEVGDTGLYLRDGETAFFAGAEDVDSIYAAMKRVVDLPEFAAKVGVNGRTVALENFEYSNFVRPLDEFLRSVSRK